MYMPAYGPERHGDLDPLARPDQDGVLPAAVDEALVDGAVAARVEAGVRWTTWNWTLWMCIGCGMGELLIHSQAMVSSRYTISSSATAIIS